MAAVERLAVVIEAGDKKVFASAVDWPGWSRAARNRDEAIERLVAYGSRYALVAHRAGLMTPRAFEVEVVEAGSGGTGTDFGVPGLIHDLDGDRVSAAEAARLAAIVRASWEHFGDVVAGAPAELRKGPRGGGRDRDKMVAHVVEADAAYAREIGVKVRAPSWNDAPAIEAMRVAMLEVLGAPSDGSPLAGRRWTQRYAARRIAWHALDHAWEMHDRSQPDAPR